MYTLLKYLHQITQIYKASACYFHTCGSLNRASHIELEQVNKQNGCFAIISTEHWHAAKMHARHMPLRPNNMQQKLTLTRASGYQSGTERCIFHVQTNCLGSRRRDLESEDN